MGYELAPEDIPLHTLLEGPGDSSWEPAWAPGLVWAWAIRSSSLSQVPTGAWLWSFRTYRGWADFCALFLKSWTWLCLFIQMFLFQRLNSAIPHSVFGCTTEVQIILAAHCCYFCSLFYLAIKYNFSTLYFLFQIFYVFQIHSRFTRLGGNWVLILIQRKLPCLFWAFFICLLLLFYF